MTSESPSGGSPSEPEDPDEDPDEGSTPEGYEDKITERSEEATEDIDQILEVDVEGDADVHIALNLPENISKRQLIFVGLAAIALASAAVLAIIFL